MMVEGREGGEGEGVGWDRGGGIQCLSCYTYSWSRRQFGEGGGKERTKVFGRSLARTKKVWQHPKPWRGKIIARFLKNVFIL